MKRLFIASDLFTELWKKTGLSEEDLRDFQNRLLENPKAGTVIQGTGGLRKIRVAFSGKGESGSGRIIYIDFEEIGTIYLFFLYGKNEKENLTKTERNDLRNDMGKLRKAISDRRGRNQ